MDSDRVCRRCSRISTPNTTTATSRSNRNATSRISGSPAATTRLAIDTPFSREKNPTAWLTTSRRTIINTNATSTTATDRLSAVVGSTSDCNPNAPTVKIPNPATRIDTITSLATPNAPLPAISVPVSRNRCSTTNGTMITFNARDIPASTYSSGIPRPGRDHHRQHGDGQGLHRVQPVSYTHLRAHETDSYLVCR